MGQRMVGIPASTLLALCLLFTGTVCAHAGGSSRPTSTPVGRGTGGWLQGGVPAGAAATVDGEQIPLSQLHFVVRMVARRVAPGRRHAIPRRALQGLIDATLLAREARRLGVKLPPKAVRRWIEGNPLFRRSGRFRPALFRMHLKHILRMSEAVHSRRLEAELLAGLMRRRIVRQIRPTQSEIERRYRAEHVQLRLDALSLRPSSVAGRIVISDRVIAGFVAKNRGRIQAYYRDNNHRYIRPHKVRARQILLRLKPKAPADKVRKALARARKILGEVKRPGASFAALARKYTEGPNGWRGGDLLYFSRGRVVKRFGDQAFTMKLKEVRGPFRTVYGVHIIKLVGIQEGRNIDLATASRPIARELVAFERTMTALRAPAAVLLRALAKGADPKKLARREIPLPGLGPGVKIKPAYSRTPWFVAWRGIAVPGLGVGRDLAAPLLALSMKRPTPSKPLIAGGAIHAVKLAGLREPSATNRPLLLAQTRRKLLRSKGRNALRALIRRLRSRAVVRVMPGVLAGADRLIPR